MTKFEAINWNQIANRVDYSAWSRLNDFIWEPERIPVFKDKKEFESLGDDVKEAVQFFVRLQHLLSYQRSKLNLVMMQPSKILLLHKDILFTPHYVI